MHGPVPDHHQQWEGSTETHGIRPAPQWVSLILSPASATTAFLPILPTLRVQPRGCFTPLPLRVCFTALPQAGAVAGTAAHRAQRRSRAALRP